MKTTLLSLLFFISFSVKGTNYYFSSVTGDDGRSSAQAQNPATPWQTLTKLNSFFSSLNPGDSILFKRGEKFYGSIVVNKSGTSMAPIVLSAFGSGADPVITGFTFAGSWYTYATNLWESLSAVSTLTTCNILSISGNNYAKGRIPKTGYWTIGSTGGNSIVDGTNLNAGTNDWTGAQVVLRKYRWIMDRYTINSASGSTINFTNTGDDVQAGWGYFIQNDPRLCTAVNEWAYNSSNKRLTIYSVVTPPNVMVPTVEEGVFMNGEDYIIFDNLKFEGFNTTGINTDSRTGIEIKNCDFSFIGVNAIYAYPNSNGLKVTGSTFTESNSRGIHAGSSSNALISHNNLLNIGNFAGMGSNGDDSYTGIISNGDDAEVSYNSITNAGYVGIRWDGHGAVIKNNFVNTTNYIKDDGGGIYCYPNQTGPSDTVTYAQRTVRDNIVINSIGAIAGGEPSSGFEEAMGIYNDGTSPFVSYINNTISGCPFGLFSNSGRGMLIDSNKIFDCKRGLHLVKYSGFPINDWTITNNQLVAKEATQYSAYYEPDSSAIPPTWDLSNNIYARPIDDDSCIWIDSLGNNRYKTLAQWKATSFASGEDANSKKSPKSISSVADIRIEYNSTSVSKTIDLGAYYMDITGTSAYNGVIILEPYQSAILIKIGEIVLPLYLIEFTAKAERSKVLLNWQTANEVRSSHFEVERANKKIGRVNAGFARYAFTDSFPKPGINNYRLKIVDQDGLFSYSKIVTAEIKSVDGSASFNNGILSFNVTSAISQAVTISLYDMAGRLLFISKEHLRRGNNVIVKKVKLKSGIYYAKLISNYETSVFRIVSI